jgi:hypothetical protein
MAWLSGLRSGSRASASERPRYDVRRRGWGRKDGRFGLFSLLSLAFWALIARIALREGRIVVVTGDKDAGHDVILRLLPGRAYGAPELEEAGPDVPMVDVIPQVGHFKLDGPRDLPVEQFRDVLDACASERRGFTISAHDANWLAPEIKRYSRLTGARPVFWLSLV